jgi:hypothetical protein
MLAAGCEKYYQHYVEEAEQQQEEESSDNSEATKESSGGSSGGNGSGSSGLVNLDHDWDLDLEDDNGAVLCSNWNLDLDQDSDGDLDGEWGPANWDVDGRVSSDRSVRIELAHPGWGTTFKLKGTVNSSGNGMSGSWKTDPAMPAPNHEGDWDANR